MNRSAIFRVMFPDVSGLALYIKNAPRKWVWKTRSITWLMNWSSPKWVRTEDFHNFMDRSERLIDQHDTTVGQWKKSESPTGIEPMTSCRNTGRALQPLSYENPWKARSFNWVHMWKTSCILQGSALYFTLSHARVLLINLSIKIYYWA